MAQKFASGLTGTQMLMARRFEAAGLCSISQAVKAFERKDWAKITIWKQQLEAKQAEK